jgi:upstream activation factor subunit UAF30
VFTAANPHKKESNDFNMADFTDEDLRGHIHGLIPRIDLESTGLKKFIKLLSKELDGMDLLPRKAFIKQTLTEEINRLSQQEDDDEDDGNEEAEVEQAKSPKGGLAQQKEISQKLAAFLGRGKTMARTEIVKALWEYIRSHDLQNPSNRQEILLDRAMKEVFGCDAFTMFTMNKYIGAHVHPYTAVDLTPKAKSPRKRKAPQSSEKAKKGRKAGTQPPYQLSSELAAVVGQPILPRPQVVSKIWEYIKANDLQNPNDGREILCDEKLRAVMKTNKVSMFKMNQLISPHMLEKVDRSLYEAGDEGASDAE